MNQGNTDGADRQDLFAGTLGGPRRHPGDQRQLPVGQELAASTPEATITARDRLPRSATTWNVIAETRKGNRQNVVMAGAHLDSVPEGNGINDNGSGSAALLETAEAMADMKRKPENRVRFAWWGAEELGLLGSEHYVADLSTNQPRQFQNIALYLNFDMVGSPNYKLGVYDGDNNAFPPEVSAARAGGLGRDRASVRQVLRPARHRLGSDRVQRPQRLRPVHRAQRPGRRPVHRRRGHQDR